MENTAVSTAAFEAWHSCSMSHLSGSLGDPITPGRYAGPVLEQMLSIQAPLPRGSCSESSLHTRIDIAYKTPSMRTVL